MYMKKPQKQLVRLAFDPGMYIVVNNQTNELKTTGYWDVSESLVWSGTISMIVYEWEIFKIFFDKNNVVPKWIVGNYTVDEFDEESGEWTAGLITTVRYKILNCHNPSPSPSPKSKSRVQVEFKSRSKSRVQV